MNGPPPRLRRSEPVMGTVATVELRDPLPAGEAERLADEVFTWLHEVDRRFSTFKVDSEVSRFDRGEMRLSDCSPDMRDVVEQCAELWRRTDGYFDVYATGRFDPSGYVKGWSVQVASEKLTAAGAVNHLVDAGGDIQSRGRPAPGEEWQIGVRHPWDPTKLSWVLSGVDLAVATSGSYERGPHVIDPRTGRPASRMRSVTLVGRHLGLADAYATAAVAMGAAGLTWLAGLTDHECAVVTEDQLCFRSVDLPVVLPAEDGPATAPTAAGARQIS